MQQFWLSKGHAGAHLAFKQKTSNLWSSRTAFKALCCLDDVIIFCGCPQKQGPGFDLGIIVSYCLCCFPLSDLFILKALRASGGKEAWAWDGVKKGDQLTCMLVDGLGVSWPCLEVRVRA